MATKTYRNFDQVAQHFKCPVHIGKLKDPRRLPCEHTLCKDCLKGVIKAALKKEDHSGKFDCPECRAKHHIPSTETEDWADWFPVDAFCAIQLKTLARFQDSQVCEIHPDKFKEYYCFHHRELYCADCIISKHTTSPCYARNSKDSVNDVRKHINDLIGQLRLQEERSLRIAQSKIAETHIDDLLQKVWEVEHMIDRFQKHMKKKIQEARQQIEVATKTPPADKEHLKITQKLITQTKRLVEDKLKLVNTKTQEGQNDLLRLWKPLHDQVEHFGTVLNAVEKRPFCVNVQVDEPFMDMITMNNEPVVVLNESAHWTPLNPKIVKILEQNPFRSARQSESMKETKKTTFKPELLATPRSNNETSTSMPRSRTSFRTLKQSAESRRTMPQESNTQLQDQYLREKNPTILPKLTANALMKVDSSKVFNVRGMKLRAISQQSAFEFPCEDIVVLDNNIITVTERAVQKFSLRYQFLESLRLRAPLKLCYLRDDSHYVLCLDNNCGLSLICTQPRLRLQYRIETDRAYTGVCHMRTTMTEDAYGRCLYHLHLALLHVWNREDCVDVMVATYEKVNQIAGFLEEITITPTNAKTICGSNDDPVLVNMFAICPAPDNRKLIVCAESGVVCLSRNGDIIWTFPTSKPASSADSKRGLIFVAVELEKRVLILDPHGNLLVDNIFPTGCKLTRPSRVSVGKSSMIVREFNDHDTRGLKSIVHVFTLTYQ